MQESVGEEKEKRIELDYFAGHHSLVMDYDKDTDVEYACYSFYCLLVA